LELHGKSGCAANFLKSGAIVFHRWIIWQTSSHFAKDVGCVGIWRLNQAVVNPLAITARGNYTRAAQIGKMPRDFRLIYLQNFHEKTHANLVVSDEIDQPQTRVIGKRFEEKCDVVLFVSHAVF